MYSVELNGNFIRQGSNRTSLLSFFRQKLSEISGTTDVIRLWWNDMVILGNENKIYNTDDNED